ncbi:LOW QUALITY PROTEIN: uncharacterized protein EMH_0019860 [Eimeria mitis]|uniref:Uncharacterized protein n=1 Tax=Eimeria mitis TaxID=44415 RepID=U6KC45_9EIME|nr:LOW QUALITY PROTEIN: uncharacterized protein EMH_0019860 [Eimeria mitis]CDJ34341.1 hypothetical protein EMH_0019860 [Eimeria mitis]
MPTEKLPPTGLGAPRNTNVPPLPPQRSPVGTLPSSAAAGGAAAAAARGGAAGSAVPAHLRRGRSLLVLTQDNQYKLSAPPADPHGARSPSRDAWRPTITSGAATSPRNPGERPGVVAHGAGGAPVGTSAETQERGRVWLHMALGVPQ